MSKWKYSQYNINLRDDGYPNAKKDEYYNILLGKFTIIPNDVNLDNPPGDLKGFLVPFDVDETKNFMKRQDELFNEEYPSHLSLVIAVTMSCNYRCEYCFQGEHSANANMSDETIDDTISYIKKEIDNNDKLKSLGVTFFGGEPLMNMGAIRKISRFLLTYTKEKGISYRAAIDTNGFFMKKEISAELKELGVVKAQIAFDGLEDFYNTIRKAPKDAYKKVLKNIEDSEIPIVIRVNVTKKNQDEAKELIRYLYTLQSVKDGKDTLSIMRVNVYDRESDYNFTDDEWLQFRECLTDYISLTSAENLFKLQTAAPFACAMLKKHNVVIGVDGNLYRCDRQVCEKGKEIGNLKDGINDDCEIEKSFRSIILNEDCMKCKYLPLCGGDGGCRLDYLEQGNNCDLVKGKFRQDMSNYLKYVRTPKHKNLTGHGSFLDCMKKGIVQ